MSDHMLLQRYRSEMQRLESPVDPAQVDALLQFQHLFDQLAAKKPAFGGGLIRRLAGKKSIQPRGIYVWGGVGRGKTFLMDLFYEAVPVSSKKRIHFHRFMQGIHGSLKHMRDMQNPLERIGRDFSEQHRLLCLDEFFVLDIGDAVILSGLLSSLIENGVIIVTTSNTRPDDLYRGGIQRDRFVHAIRLINTRMDVIRIEDGTDYRLKSLSGQTLYYSTLGAETDAALEADYRRLSGRETKTGGQLEILGRKIRTVGHAEHAVWFEFSDICDGPRSKADYIEIANLYRTVLVTGIPLLSWEFENQARRFIEMVDEFYDRGVHLIVSAEASIDQLYTGTRLVREYERTASRLHEMQSEKYLSRAHCG